MSKDMEVLNRWEKETGKKLKRASLGKIAKEYEIGYTIDENEKIIGINLFNSGISDISFLKELKNLTTLDLSHNQISDYSFLKELKNLTTLYLSYDHISDISFLKELKNLTMLYLRNIQISDYSFLKELKNLTMLYLRKNQISDISFLKELKNLTTLDLSYNQISDISFLKELKNLTTLYLSDNQISDYSFLKELKNLVALILRNNQISDYSFLKELKNLTTLDLTNNQISDISFIKDLENLTTLYLSDNQISDYSFIKDLENLTTLYLRNNQISDYSFLKDLENLATLDLRNNQISDYSFLKDLENLATLDLSSNQISDISFLKELKNLATLDLSSNQISDISFLKELKNLATLDLSSNQISDISFLKELKNLATLDITKNKITNLPVELVDLKIEIKWEEYFSNGINLYDNPLETPPIEIVKKGKDAIRAYFKSIQGEKQPLNEVKVLLVGDGGSGKTSLAKQLMGEMFDNNEPQTHGINIRQWEIQDGGDKIKVHLWDFGGQEIMHATHQFFLSRRSLYVLVLDGRKEEKTEYWLKHVESFGGNSHVLVVINKIDENPSFDVNRPFLQEKYKSLNGFYRISCKDGRGLQDFKEGLRKDLLNVELCRHPFAKSWFNVKNQLENMTGNYMSYKEYLEYCAKENVNEKDSQETLVDFLNDLGIILHFKDFQLEDTYVLEPRWVTNAVYKIINSEKLSINKGVLKLNLLDEILEKKDDLDFFYPRDKYRYIIDLMKKFELCFGIDGDTILIPDLLEVQEPGFDFPYAQSLKFIFEYDFLPRSVMPRFIVKMHIDILDQLRWRTGVVLEDKNVYNSKAVIKADERDKKIFIYVSGEQKRNYFSTIRKTLRDINKSFEKLEVKELVPLPDNDKITVEYSELIGLERMGKRDISIGKMGKDYSIKKLLDGIEREEERMKQKDLNDNEKIIINQKFEFNNKINNNEQQINIPVIEKKSEPIKTESWIDQLANPATLAGFIGWGGSVIITIYGIKEWNYYLLISGIIIFLILVILKLRHK
jgi:small GTP-binding protein